MSIDWDIFGLKARRENAMLKEMLSENQRAFSGAKVNRFNEDWVSHAIQTNNDIRRYGDVLRARSRELAKNSSDYRKYLNMCERNVVGPNGIKLQMHVRLNDGGKDVAACKYIESEYADFSKRGNCTADRKHSMRDLDKLIVRSWRIDGEVFLRRIRGFGNKHLIAYQMLDPAACPMSMNEIAPNGNRILMGVELDVWNAPVAYYFHSGRTSETGDYLPYEAVVSSNPNQRYVRLPASEINHIFSSEFPNQIRGFPFGQAAMQDIYLLGGYFYTELVAADASSRKLGKMINKSISPSYGGRNSEKPQKNTQVINSDAGSWDVLYGEWDMQTYDPQHPAGNFPPFVKSQKRNIANGLDVAYNTFANDLEGVNYSSIRTGVLDERDAWMDAQEFIIDNYKQVEFAAWLEMQFLRNDFLYYPSAFERLNEGYFIGRRWTWVDPLKDGESNLLQIALGSTTPQDIAANLGTDFDENVESISEAVLKLEPLQKYIAMVKKIRETFDVLPNSSKEKVAPKDEDDVQTNA